MKLRRVLINNAKYPQNKGLFHLWVKQHQYTDGFVPCFATRGLIELENGKLVELDPMYFTFLDTKELLEAVKD